MRKELEQQITSSDLQTLIKESGSHRKWDCFYKVAQIILTPVIITVVSLVATTRINEQQASNTEKITQQQIKSARLIADANRAHSAKIAESNQRIERLNHIKEIFKTFLTDDTDQEFEAQRMQLISMEVYKEDSLLFLLNVKEHYQSRLQQISMGGNDPNNQKDKYERLINQAEKSIQNILMNSQIDVSNRIFIGKNQVDNSSTNSAACVTCACKSIENELKDDACREKIKASFISMQWKTRQEYADSIYHLNFMDKFNKLQLSQINLRQQEYKNFNFTDSAFINANLYNSDFSSCTLMDNFFFKVDLQEAKFTGSNLSGSLFVGTNLKEANFLESMLRSVLFVNPIMSRRDAGDELEAFCAENTCCELEGAQFSLGSLLWTSTPPFDVFDRNRNNDVGDVVRQERLNLYLNLLKQHADKIKTIADAAERGDAKAKKKLDNLLVNTETKSSSKLIDLLESEEKKATLLAKPGTPIPVPNSDTP